MRGTFQMQATGCRPKIVVTADGRGVIGHAGARLLADVADVTGLASDFTDALAPMRRRRSGHRPGRVAIDLAVMLADGGEAITDMAVLRDQRELFGQVASDATMWRVLDGIDDQALQRLRAARAAAREVAWAQLTEIRGRLPASKAAGREVLGLVIDIDTSIVECHSEKENAAPTWKRSFGYYPIFAFLDNTREALAGLLRNGNAGSDTADDHIEVLDMALAQIPDAHRYSQDLLIRADSAGCSKAFLRHIRGLRRLGMRKFFSVGVPVTQAIRDAIVHASAWILALDADNELRDSAQVVEITHLVKPSLLAAYPDGTRLIVRRERPHPGAKLDLFDTIEGFRHQIIACDAPVAGGGSIQYLEARHRAHSRVEDRIRCGKDSGFGRFPSRQFNINQVWLELALTGPDLITWTQHLLLDGELAVAEPKNCVTGCCTPPPASCIRHGDSCYASTPPGPGQPNSPTPSAACNSYHSRSHNRTPTHPYQPRSIPATDASTFGLRTHHKPRRSSLNQIQGPQPILNESARPVDEDAAPITLSIQRA